jgi:hypothetical protein
MLHFNRSITLVSALVMAAMAASGQSGIAPDGAQICATTTTSPSTCSYTVGAGGNALLLVAVATSNTNVAVDFNGASLSLVGSVASGMQTNALYALANTPAGDGQVQISFSGSDPLSYSISSYTGAGNVVQMATESGTLSPGCPSSPTNALTFSTTTPNSWVVVSWMQSNSQAAYAATNGTVLRNGGYPANGVSMADSGGPVSTPGPIALYINGCSDDGQQYAGVLAEIGLPGSGPPTSYNATSEVIPAGGVAAGWTPAIFPIPSSPPAIGSTAGSTIVDTSIPTSATIMRITTPADSPTGSSMVVPALGDRNIWSVDGTHALYFDNNYSVWRLLTLNLANWPAPSTIVSKTNLPANMIGCYFSYTNANLIYCLKSDNTNIVLSYDISTSTASKVFDFSTISGWNGVTGSGEFAISGDDRWACTQNGSQNNAWLVACYDTLSGHQWLLDTIRNTVAEDNGMPQALSAYTYPPGMMEQDQGLHEIEFGNGSQWISVQGEITPVTYWNIGGDPTNVLAETVDDANHMAMGYNYGARGMGDQCNSIGLSDSRVFTLRPFSAYNVLDSWIRLDPCVPASMQGWDNENHLSWANGAGSPAFMQDQYPIFVNTTLHLGHSQQQWLDSELVAFETDGVQQTVWHFAHNYTSYSPGGCPAYLVGPHPSRDGHWLLFNSDWLGALGKAPPGDGCSAYNGYRMDVFLMKLQ